MTARRTSILVVVCAFFLAAGCASATQPALEVADQSFSRSELIDAVTERLGEDNELPGVLSQAAFNTAVNDLVIDELGAEIAAEVDRRGVEPTAEDLAEMGVDEDFDPDTLPADQRSNFDISLDLTSLRRVITAEGGSGDEYVAGLLETIRIDPRYGTYTSGSNIIPPRRSSDTTSTPDEES